MKFFRILERSSSSRFKNNILLLTAYDNERGKGDHKHVGEIEEEYVFESLERLLADFRRDVENWS